ncbi:GPW/gp25 family protein [Actinomadura fibrosa]|uniref:GPW/gp25 family protein n=1 Tax=Actinomadura fibrosa TaxID=111802 RepID=A0ABW2Y054_9ACTN|nr:GPW/gp25 family protein [Actinomadura fibrosa]
MTGQFYGRGPAFPLRLDGGGVAESAGAAKVAESIRIVLGTQHGERVMRPTFGANLRSLAFAPNNGATADLARHYVTDALARWEPRIDVLDVAVANDDVRLLIDVQYRLRATNEVRNLVYPFYLEGGR